MHPSASAAVRKRFNYGALVNGFFWLTVASGSIVFIEPSPYDFLILITIVLWAAGGFSVHRAVMPNFILLSLWTFGGFLSLIPYWNEADPVDFMFHTLFISTTGLFYALFLSQKTGRRLDLLLTAYTASCVLASVIAIVTWLGAFGEGDDWVRDGRAMAPFKDPNVLGSYLVLGVAYTVQRLLLGRMRYIWLTLPSLMLIATALFLSFSRGSMGAALFALVMIVAFLIKTADIRRMRLRVLGGAAAVFLMGAVGLMAALSSGQRARILLPARLGHPGLRRRPQWAFRQPAPLHPHAAGAPARLRPAALPPDLRPRPA